MLVINKYSRLFNYAWDVYSKTHSKIIKACYDTGMRKDEIYVASSAGSKQTASSRWEYLKDNIVIKDVLITEDQLATAVELFCADREREMLKFQRARLPMMSVFLNVKPKVERDIEILDYIRRATNMDGAEDDEQV